MTDFDTAKKKYKAGDSDAPYEVLFDCRVDKKPLPAWVADAIISDWMRRGIAEDQAQKKSSAKLRREDECVSIYCAIKFLTAKALPPGKKIIGELLDPNQIGAMFNAHPGLRVTSEDMRQRELRRRGPRLTWRQAYERVAEKRSMSLDSVKNGYIRGAKLVKQNRGWC